MVVPKIKLGKDSRKGFHPKRHDVNTTADFGFVQPTLCEYLPADSSVTLQSGTFVRLAPMPCPSFARVSVKQKTRFVDIHEIFEAYDYLQSHQPVNLLHRNYIPLKADSIKSRLILGHMINMSLYASRYDDLEHLQNLMFRCSVWSNAKLYQGEEKVTEYGTLRSHSDLKFSTTGYRWKDVMNDPEIVSNRYRQYNGYHVIDAVCRKAGQETGEYVFSQGPLWQAIQSYTGMTNLLYPQNGSDGIDFSPNIKFFMTDIERSPSPLPTATTHFYDGGNWPDINQPLGSLWRFDYYNEGSAFNVTGAYDALDRCRVLNNSGEFMSGMSIENADFVIPLKLSSSGSGVPFGRNIRLANDDGTDGEVSKLYDICVCFHLTNFGRRLMKVLLGCGYMFKYQKEKSLLPLLGFYKAWFDSFNPGRDRQWRDTPAYYLIHTYYDTGTDLSTVFASGYPSSVESGTLLRYQTQKAWLDLLGELSRCVYCQPIDNVTVATKDLYNSSVAASAVGVATLNEVDETDEPLYRDYDGSSRKVPQEYDGNNIDGLSVKAVQRLYTLFNKNSVIGARVDKYLRAHFGYGLPESNVLGDSDLLCDIGDVFSTTQNEDVFLGEYGGRGIGGQKIDKAPRMRFETAKPGYLYNLLYVVPDGGYVQGTKDEPLNRYDFFDSFYDCLGKETLNMSNIENRTSVFWSNTAVNASDKVFGFVPRYFGLKIKNSLANGGFALRSMRSQFLPYSLDRLFDEDDIVLSGDGVELTYVPGVSLVADESLRYIGLNERYGNYNRLFFDTSGRTDNFIIDIVHDFKHWFPGKSLQDSFETFDQDTDNATVEVEHA